MSDLGLPPVPLGEFIDRVEVVGIGDAAFTPGIQRVFQRFHAGQVVDYEIGVAPELVTLIEVLRPVVGELDAGNAEGQGGGDEEDEPEQERAARDDECAEAIEKVGTSRAGAGRAQWQD